MKEWIAAGDVLHVRQQVNRGNSWGNKPSQRAVKTAGTLS